MLCKALHKKGKIEVFNRTLEKFVVEEKREHPSSIEQVQHDLDCWMESFYLDVPHSALNQKTPRQAFLENRKIQRFVSSDELNRAFRATESRLVDKTGCLSFGGKKWEAGPAYIGFKVDVSYASDNPTELVIEHPNMEPAVIHELRIGEHTTERLKPRPFVDTDGSRVIEAARRRKEDEHDRTGATRFKDI